MALRLNLKGIKIMNPWNIKQLKEAMLKDLQSCNTDFERSMVKAIGGREIREKAIEFAKVRKLTPGEVAIASEFGYRG
jgi:hypothetical protein